MIPDQPKSVHTPSSIEVIRSHVQAFLSGLSLPTPPVPVVLAVSGGPDSLCMADVIISLQSETSISPIIAHLNHGLRGQDAAEDLEFVRGFAASHQTPFHSEVRDVRTLAAHEHLSIEAAARVARYDFLASVAKAAGARYIALAHNADDQVETVLQRLIRGTGITGLQGMKPVSPLRRADGAHGEPISLLRPLLAIPRTMIEAYCKARALNPRHDATNDDRHHMRNRIRHDLLPLIEQFNPGFRSVVLRLAETAASDVEIVHFAAQQALDHVRLSTDDVGAIDRQAWSALPVSLQRATLRELVLAFNGELTNVTYAGIEEARDVLNSAASHAQIAIHAKVRIIVTSHKFRLVHAPTDLL